MTDQTVSIEIKAVKTAAPENDTQTQVKKEEKKEEKVNSMISRLESDKLAATTVLAEVSSNSTFTQWQSDRVSSRRVCVLHFLHFSNFQCLCVCHHIDHGCE